MAGLQYDLTLANQHPIEQGVTFTLQAKYWLDKAKTILKDLTDYTARMEIRDCFDSQVADLFVHTDGPVGDNIVLGGAAGTVVVHISAAVAAALKAPFRGVYDLILIDPSQIPEKFLTGIVEIVPLVSTTPIPP